MKLYLGPVAPNPRRVRAYMAEKGIDLPAEEVDMLAGEHFCDDYRAVNPLCTIPALILDDGTVLAQVPAILGYLEELYPEPPLFGDSPEQRAITRDWCHRIYLEGFISIGNMLRNTNEIFKNRGLPGPLDLEQIPELAKRGKVQLDYFFKVMDKRLQESDFLAGPDFTMADIDGLIVVDFAAMIGQEIPDDCTALKAWYQAMQKRPCATA